MFETRNRNNDTYDSEHISASLPWKRTWTILWDCFWIVLRRFLSASTQSDEQSHLKTISCIYSKETNLCIQIFTRRWILWYFEIILILLLLSGLVNHAIVWLELAAPMFTRKELNICIYTCIYSYMCICLFISSKIFCTVLPGFFAHAYGLVRAGRSHIYQEGIQCNFLPPCKSAITHPL